MRATTDPQDRIILPRFTIEEKTTSWGPFHRLVTKRILAWRVVRVNPGSSQTLTSQDQIAKIIELMTRDHLEQPGGH